MCPFEQTLRDSKTHTVEIDEPELGLPLLVTTSPIFDDTGELIGSVHIAKDMRAVHSTKKELEQRLHDLEVFHKIAIGRELKMVEMKERIRALERALHEPPGRGEADRAAQE